MSEQPQSGAQTQEAKHEERILAYRLPQFMPRFFRVYNSGDFRIESADVHLESLEWRPGCALFRDGKCVQEGYLSAERIAAIEAHLTKGAQ